MKIISVRFMQFFRCFSFKKALDIKLILQGTSNQLLRKPDRLLHGAQRTLRTHPLLKSAADHSLRLLEVPR